MTSEEVAAPVAPGPISGSPPTSAASAPAACSVCAAIRAELAAVRTELDRAALLLLGERRRAEEAEARFRGLARALGAAGGNAGATHPPQPPNGLVAPVAAPGVKPSPWGGAAAAESSAATAVANVATPADALSGWDVAAAGMQKRQQQIRQARRSMDLALGGGMGTGTAAGAGGSTAPTMLDRNAGSAVSLGGAGPLGPLAGLGGLSSGGSSRTEILATAPPHGGGSSPGGAAAAHDLLLRGQAALCGNSNGNGFVDDSGEIAGNTIDGHENSDRSPLPGPARVQQLTGQKRKAAEEGVAASSSSSGGGGLAAVAAAARATSADAMMMSANAAFLRLQQQQGGVAMGGPPSNGGGGGGSNNNRRGDPRMNAAVSAKLSDSSITLLDALVRGGFVFPTHPHHPGGIVIGGAGGADMGSLDDPQRNVGTNDKSVLDAEGVSLYQRKNQLNRRLRRAKVEGGGDPVSIATSIVPF